MLKLAALALISHAAAVAVAPAAPANWVTFPRPAQLDAVSLKRVADGADTYLRNEIGAQSGATLVVLGTYPSDFNMIEYGQKLSYYLPELQARGVSRTLVVVNGERAACQKLAELLSLPADVELLADPSGELGRTFGVSRGWQPDSELNPYVKLFGMLWGLGASATLPSVITGYLGNPSGKNGWIEKALAQGLAQGREVLGQPEIVKTDAAGAVVANKFNELPVVGGWGRRPLELATLRLQNMIGVSMQNWEELKPSDDRCLTQLGGCALYTAEDELAYFWKDGGICNTADFEALLEMAPALSK